MELEPEDELEFELEVVDELGEAAVVLLPLFNNLACKQSYVCYSSASLIKTITRFFILSPGQTLSKL